MVLLQVGGIPRDADEVVEAAAVAGDEVNGRVGAVDEVAQIEGLAQNEEGGTEGVAFFEFGVFRLFHEEAPIPEVTEGTATVRFPGNANPVPSRQLLGADVGRQDGLGAAVGADMVQKSIEVPEAQETGEDVERTFPRLDGPFDIAPEPFERRGAQCLVGTVPDGAAEEDEIIGGLHLPLQPLFGHAFEFQYLGAFLIHDGDCLVLQRCNHFS